MSPPPSHPLPSSHSSKPTPPSHLHQHVHSARAQQMRSPPPPQLPNQRHHQPGPNPHLHGNGATSNKPRQQRPSAANSSSRPGSVNGVGAPNESVRGRTLTYKDLSQYFHLPIDTAAKELGVCVTALKKQCRKHNIMRWPHRKLKSLDKLKEKLEKEQAKAADKEYYKHEIHSIVQKKDHIFRSGTNAPLDPATQVDNNDARRRSTPPPPDHRITTRPSQPFPMPDHSQIHGHPPLMISGPVPMPSRTVTLSASHPPQGAMGPPTMAPVAIQGPPVSICGVIGCDCYMSGGVSTQNYHMPLSARPPLAASNGALVPALPMNASGPMHTSPPFYGSAPAPYPYATPVPYPPPQPTPFQNMVQVNVLEQQPYGHQAGPASNPSQVTPPAQRSAPSNGSPLINGSPNIIQAGQVTVSQTSTPNATPNPSAYEVYPQSSNGPISQPQGGYVYGSFPSHSPVPVEGVVQGPQSNGSAPQLVPHYWTEAPHTSNRNNLVTMYNQTTHYHHHHPASGRVPGGGHMDGTASSATNNSDAADSRRMSINMNGNGAATSTGPGLSSQNAVQRTTDSPSRKRGASTQECRPLKFSKSDNGEPAPRTDGKVAAAGEHSVPIREPKRPNAVQKPVPGDEFKSGSRVDMRVPCRASEPPANSVTAGKKLAKAGEERSRHERSEHKPMRAEKAPPPRMVGGLQSSQRVRSGADQPGEGNRMIVTGAEGERMKAMRSDNGQMINGIELQNNSRRSPNKRPRNGMVESGSKSKGWEGTYLTAGNTGVPAIRHGGGGEGPGIREITPPSDREETPFDPQDNLGSGTGSGTGSGSGSGNENGEGDGTGSGDGSGSGSGDGTGSGEGSGSGDSDKDERRGMDPPSPMRNGMKRRSGKHIEWRMNGMEDGVGVSNAASGSSAVVRAKRYEQVIHHCVSLSCAQWCTDKKLRVTISLGSKSLLGLAGVGGHGRLVLEGEGMLEGKHAMQKRYTSVLKGQRVEWLASDGRKRYLVVLSPFRKRGCVEVLGVSGLLMELTQGLLT